MAKVSRATDTIFLIQKTSAQDVDAFLDRSDYPEIYDVEDLSSAFHDGWHHFRDEPDLLHKKTENGMSFSIHPGPPKNDSEKTYFMSLHNPEGVSQVGWFDGLPEAVQAQEEISRSPSNIRKHLHPDPHQNRYVSLLHAANKDANGEATDEHGMVHSVNGLRDTLSRMKASEEAIEAGGDSLTRSLQEAYARRGL